MELFENDLELYKYIRDTENQKMFDDHPEFKKCPWTFSLFSPERVGILIRNLKKVHKPEILEEAWQKQLGLIEICKGDYNNLTEIILTPDINEEALRKNWCKEYCEAHQLILEEE
jgi:hypothetical protein